MKADVSVIVPARNEEQFIEGCIRSLLAEDVGLEVIVIDDASTDRTVEVVRSMASNQVRVLENARPLGRGGARNRGIDAASGRFIAPHDADDLALPGRLSALESTLSREASLVAIGGQCVALDARFGLWRHMAFPTDPIEIRVGLRHGRMTICHGGSLIRKEALDRVGGYDDHLPRAQDFALYRKLSGIGFLAALERDVLLYRHPVFLPWSYWAASRAGAEAVLGEGKNWRLWPARFVGANARRGIRFMQSHGPARRAWSEMLLRYEAPRVDAG